MIKKNTHAVVLGRRGGKVTSDAKTAAARENGKKGGRPKGRPRKPRVDPSETPEGNAPTTSVTTE